MSLVHGFAAGAIAVVFAAAAGPHVAAVAAISPVRLPFGLVMAQPRLQRAVALKWVHTRAVNATKLSFCVPQQLHLCQQPFGLHRALTASSVR